MILFPWKVFGVSLVITVVITVCLILGIAVLAQEVTVEPDPIPTNPWKMFEGSIGTGDFKTTAPYLYNTETGELFRIFNYCSSDGKENDNGCAVRLPRFE